MQVGSNISKAGFISKAMFARGVTSSELETRLGFRQGRLSDGWFLLFMNEMPSENEFAFRGYSQMSGGVAQGHLANPPDPRTSEERLKDDGYNIGAMKSRIIKDVFTLEGSKRLAKVMPVKWDQGAGTYPPGSGIPQWELTAQKSFLIKAFVKPGDKWLGDYNDNAS